MGVCGADCNAFGINSLFVVQPFHNLVAHVGWHSAVVYRNEDCGVFLVVSDGERLGPEMLRHAFRFCLARGIAGKADGIIGSNINFRDPD